MCLVLCHLVLNDQGEQQSDFASIDLCSQLQLVDVTFWLHGAIWGCMLHEIWALGFEGAATK